MKLSKILDSLGSLEKNSFIKIIDNIISDEPKNIKEIEKILSSTDKGLKSADSENITKIFKLVETEFSETVKAEFVDTSSQLDILIDIIIRDGNCIMKQDWFSRLYDNELKKIKKKVKALKSSLKSDSSNIDDDRKRDYKIYHSCVETAYANDIENNREAKITDDELSILLTLSKELELSQEETKLINYTIVPIKNLDIDTVINNLKNMGVAFYSKKNSTLFVADEMVRLLRKVRKKEIADKYLRRILRLIREPQINLICRKHNIDWKLPLTEKVEEIISEGVSLTGILSKDAHRDGTSLTDKKGYVNSLWSDGLKLKPNLKGTTLEDKIANLVKYFEAIEKDEKVGISVDGYEKMLIEIGETFPALNKQLKAEFEFQEEHVLSSNLLLDYNIKPRDILDLLSPKDLKKFCSERSISTRGDEILNILDNYKDAENLYLENYENIGLRDLKSLKENGILLKESILGVKFEELTKTIFSKLGFNVDEVLRKELNTRKDKIDILLNLGNHEVIIVECKTVKESGYNKFSSVSRQLKAYHDQAKSKGYRVIKILLVAPDFSDDFISDCTLDVDLALSLVRASSLFEILDGYKSLKKKKEFSYKLLMRDVVLDEERIVKSLKQ